MQPQFLLLFFPSLPLTSNSFLPSVTISTSSSMFGHFLTSITYHYDHAHKNHFRTNVLHPSFALCSSPNSLFLKMLLKRVSSRFFWRVCCWNRLVAKREGKATPWLRIPPIKGEGSGDRSWVRFWISSCAKLDSVWKIFVRHLEEFSPKHKCWLQQHLNLGKYSKSRLRIRSEFF